MGSGSVVGKGKVVGIAVAVDGYSGYFLLIMKVVVTLKKAR